MEMVLCLYIRKNLIEVTRKFLCLKLRDTLMVHAKVATYEHAEEILQMEIIRQNRTKQRTTGQKTFGPQFQAVPASNKLPGFVPSPTSCVPGFDVWRLVS